MIKRQLTITVLLMLLISQITLGNIMEEVLPPSTVTRGPYLHVSTPTSMTLRWQTSNYTDTKVWFGTSVTNLSDSVNDSNDTQDHEITVTGLSPSTLYYYAIGDGSGIMESGDNYYFKTAPTTGSDEPTTVWVLGDPGTGYSGQQNVKDRFDEYVGNTYTNMMVFLGDNAYDDGTYDEFQTKFFDVYQDRFKNSVIYSTPGNHEYHTDSGAPYYDLLTFPTNGEAGGLASGTEEYYSIDYGNIHLISLNSEGSREHINSGAAMLTWLENDLAATSQKWIVVIIHRPPYSKNNRDSDDNYTLTILRENVLPICESYGVDLFLTGHNHHYDRSKFINGHYGSSDTFDTNTHLIDSGDGRLDGDGAYQQNENDEGTVYVCAGSSGYTYDLPSFTYHPVTYYGKNELGSSILETHGDQMDFKWLNQYGDIEDYFTLTKAGALGLPSISWVNPTNNETFIGLSEIAFSVDASDSDGSVNAVEFFVNGSSIGTDTSSPYTINWTPTTYGSYVLQAVVTDNDNNERTAQISIVVQDGSSVTIESQVNDGDDDAEEYTNSGEMYLTSSDLELTYDGQYQKVGMRFTGIDIPQGATITNAYIQFMVDETSSGSTNLEITGEGIDDAPTFVNSTNNISDRNVTNASVSWSPSAWTNIDDSGADQQTPNLASIVQEIVQRDGWSSGNSIALIITGTGDRIARSYNSSPNKAPKLIITYSMSTTNTQNELTSLDQISIYPIPVQNIMNIAIVSAKEKDNILKIYNQSGQLVHKDAIKLNQGETRKEINVGNLSSGVYMLRLKGEKENISKSFIIK